MNLSLALILCDDTIYHCDYVMFFDKNAFLNGSDRPNRNELNSALVEMNLIISDEVLDYFISIIGDRQFGILHCINSDNWVLIVYDEVVKILDLTTEIPQTLYECQDSI
jgi:hypothetical protein